MPKRVLIIEDNRPELDLICYLLKTFGYEPETALTGEEGVESATKAPPDLVLCDLRLPGIDGYEVAHQLRQEPHMRGKSIIAVSGTLKPGDEDRVRAEGFDGQILKPLMPELFAGQMRALLPAESPESEADARARRAAEPESSHGQDSDR